MSCPYCNKDGEVTALQDINLELIKMLGAFSKGAVGFHTTVQEPVDEKRAKDLIKYISEASAAALVARLMREIDDRTALYKELHWYKLHASPMERYNREAP